MKGDTNIRYLLQHNNNIWNEWAFKSWVESDEYTGPDMTDFGLRSQQDEEFKVQYDEQMELFKKNVLEDDEFSNKYGYLGDVYGKQWRAWKTTAGETLDQLKDVIEMIKNTRLTSFNRFCLESRRCTKYGLTALSYAIPVLCSRWKAFLSVISKKW